MGVGGGALQPLELDIATASKNRCLRGSNPALQGVTASFRNSLRDVTSLGKFFDQRRIKRLQIKSPFHSPPFNFSDRPCFVFSGNNALQ